MIPYYTLIFLPIVLYALNVKDQSLEKKNRNIMVLFFILFLLMLALRDVSIGRDMPRYNVLFNGYARMTWQKALSLDIEPLHIILSKGIAVFTDNFQVFLETKSFVHYFFGMASSNITEVPGHKFFACDVGLVFGISQNETKVGTVGI